MDKLSIRQEEYKKLVDEGSLFTCKGHSLFYRGSEFPVRMALAINCHPKLTMSSERAYRQACSEYSSFSD